MNNQINNMTDNQHKDEQQLLEAARLNPQAFGVLYDRYVRQIYRYLLSVGVTFFL